MSESAAVPTTKQNLQQPFKLSKTVTMPKLYWQRVPQTVYAHNQLDGCIVWNAHNAVLGEEALLIYIVPGCYVKIGRHGKT